MGEELKARAVVDVSEECASDLHGYSHTLLKDRGPVDLDYGRVGILILLAVAHPADIGCEREWK